MAASSAISVPTSSLRSILPHFESSLKAFQSSSSTFRIVRSINPHSGGPAPPPKTLFILDSSYNPPQKAHLALVKSALHASCLAQHAPPYRLVLLFSTHNADKAPSAASFPQRLALMAVFAEDLLRDLRSAKGQEMPVVDIGVTTAPYYTDKTAAITREAADVYPDEPTHVHLLGFDTLTRIFAAKYYPKFSPPFSALNPYFDNGHKLRVTLRPSDEYGTVESQKEFIAKLGDGELETDGGKRKWAAQIEMVEAGEGVGVSSTRVRKAAKEQDWEEVQKLCTEGVSRAIREEAVYETDDRGSKMA
ncbi:hypothetical protein MBLNU459_g5649t1 [Dothideomycetes sp. NU459]